MKVQAEGERAVVNPRMRELLVTIVSILPEVQVQYFDVDLMLEGYLAFMKYRTKEIASMYDGEVDVERVDVREDRKDHVIYEGWHEFYTGRLYWNTGLLVYIKLSQNTKSDRKESATLTIQPCVFL